MIFLKKHWKKILYILTPIVLAFIIADYMAGGKVSLIVRKITDMTKTLNKRKLNSDTQTDVEITNITTKIDPDGIDEAGPWATFDKFKHLINK